MKIQVCRDNKVFPYLLVDDWYTPEEEKLIWNELDFYTCKETLYRAEDTIVAQNFDGSPKSTSFRVYLDIIYKKGGRKFSHILRFQQPKIFSEEIKKAFKKTTPMSRTWLTCNADSTLVSYYENNDHYRPHYDQFLVTVLIWFYREPKAYSGGDFTFNDTDVILESKHNRLVMFPCYYEHSVSPIIMHNKTSELGSGRYTITHFYFTIPSSDE